jgi:hypothetical protein
MSATPAHQYPMERTDSEVCDEVRQRQLDEFRRAVIDDCRQKYRKTTVLKVAARVGLTILICGGVLGVLYAFGS